MRIKSNKKQVLMAYYLKDTVSRLLCFNYNPKMKGVFWLSSLFLTRTMGRECKGSQVKELGQ